MTLALIVALTALGSLALTGLVRRHALRTGIFDVPNERSSHTQATPRGGGVAIAATAIAALIILALTGGMPVIQAAALVAGGVAIAGIGYLDDRSGVRPLWRLAVHVLASGACLVFASGIPALRELGSLNMPWLIGGLLLVYLVWMVNLTNFMDGIDGIAATECITVCLSGAWLAWQVAPDSATWRAPLIVAAAAAGFLFWNWPPAKIFMGDSGSGFLGLSLGALSLIAGRQDERLFWAWVILLGVFVVDATVTLLRRVARGESAHLAHRSHAYQRLSRRAKGHRPVTVAVALVNLGWLLPLAVMVVKGLLSGLAGAVIGYAPLVFFAIIQGAGTPDAPLEATDKRSV